jgi:hypothetical protein
MDHVGKNQAIVLVQQYDDLVMVAFLNNKCGFFMPSQVATFSILTPP